MAAFSPPGPGGERGTWTALVTAALLLPLSLSAQDGTPPSRPAAEADPPAGLEAPGSGPLRVLDVPYLPQSTDLCGGAAAAMVMRYWGEAGVRPERFAGLIRPEEGGIRAGELASEVRRMGWRAERVGPELDAVRAHLEEGRPVILLVRVAPDRFHYVTAVAARGGEWLVHDPARAPYLRFSAAELGERWEPSGRWGMVVVPGAGGPGPEGADPGGDEGREASGPCADRVADGIAAARQGRPARADSLLRRAARRCPGAAPPRRELAGLRFRQERWAAAASLAEEALARAPGDVHAARILASSRFLQGDDGGALAAWNRVGEPRLTGVRVYGLRRTRYRPLRRQTGLSAGTALSEGGLRAARRRVAAVPAFATSRVDYRAPSDGRTELEVAVVERSVLPSTWPALGGIAARAAARRELGLGVASPTGAGELWTASWSWWEERPGVEVALATPAAFGLPGVWTVRGGWRRAAFAEGSDGSSPGDGDTTFATVVREERRRAALSVARWVTGALRLAATASLEDWSRRGRVGGVGLEAEARGAADRLALRAGGAGWAGPEGGFWKAGLEARGRWPGPGSSRLRVAAGVEAVGTRAPRMLWPGAGTGRIRRPLLRAHPLVRDGVVAGPAFGRVLAHGGIEPSVELPLSLPVSVRAAGFLDLARAWRRDGDPAAGASTDAGGRLLADLGAGLRVGLPGVGGRLRLDAATGLTDGAEALSLGWEAPWPGW